jgi:hypothetical protein
VCTDIEPIRIDHGDDANVLRVSRCFGQHLLPASSACLCCSPGHVTSSMPCEGVLRCAVFMELVQDAAATVWKLKFLLAELGVFDDLAELRYRL